jgi:hypothetical protein
MPALPAFVNSGNILGDESHWSDARVNDDYDYNIQIADLNALNAALAVIKWKKLWGFYLDLENENYSTYTIDGNMLLNADHS